MNKTTRVILVTGAAGYVGEMLCARLVKRAEVELVIALDKSPQTDFLRQLPKLVYVEHNLAEVGWEGVVRQHNPDTIIHAAWEIRPYYGQPAKGWLLNVEGSRALFNFAFCEPTIKKLIHFSTAAVYGARQDNSLTHYFTEDEPGRDDSYIYAKEKKVVEELLLEQYNKTLAADLPAPQITVFRPAAITGPRGRYLRSRFGLQSALRGNLDNSPWYKVVKLLTKVVPVTPLWVRQFIHEDDVVGIMEHLCFGAVTWSYEVFNGTPTGKPVYGRDMARAVDKHRLVIHPYLVKCIFWIFWHLTKGKISTSPGSWRFYAYPILMSGEKLAREYRCRYESITAITYTDGEYQAALPPEDRDPAPLTKPEV